MKYALFHAANMPTLGLDLRDIFEGGNFFRKIMIDNPSYLHSRLADALYVLRLTRWKAGIMLHISRINIVNIPYAKM